MGAEGGWGGGRGWKLVELMSKEKRQLAQGRPDKVRSIFAIRQPRPQTGAVFMSNLLSHLPSSMLLTAISSKSI